jgi:hypothetical protein
MPKILQHGAFGFTSLPMEGGLRIFVALQAPSPLPGWNQRTMGPMASKLGITPPRRFAVDIAEDLTVLQVQQEIISMFVRNYKQWISFNGNKSSGQMPLSNLVAAFSVIMSQLARIGHWMFLSHVLHTY